jgi:cytoskeletal protein RodZ
MKRRVSYRVTLSAVVVIILATAIALAVSVSGSPRKNNLTTVTTSISTVSYPSKDLPPSRDNDAGRARAPDATPDNDTDAWQRG